MTRAERIIEARRKLEAGEFDRAVTANEPRDLYWNRLTLECGHESQWCTSNLINNTPPTRDTCLKCAKEWIEGHSK